MSLLMDALKQQNSTQSEVTENNAVSQRGWQYLALALLVVCGLGFGVLAAFWFSSQSQTAPAALPVEKTAPALAVAPTNPPLPPANPGLILSELTTVPTTEETEAQLVISAETPTPRGQSLDEQVAIIEQFDEGSAMQEADLAAPVAEMPVSQPELTAEEVPQELKDKFRYAMAAANDGSRPTKITEHAAPARDISTLDDSLQRQIAPIRFEAHVYATEPTQRWVKVNGKDLQEGQWLTADIQLKEITPQYVLMQNGRQLFSMEALSDWSYRLKTRP